MRPDDIKQLIETGIKEATAIVEGEDGKHYSATVISQTFAGKNRVQKQQMVYATVTDKIQDGTIHALSIQTWTREEWQAQCNKKSIN